MNFFHSPPLVHFPFLWASLNHNISVILIFLVSGLKSPSTLMFVSAILWYSVRLSFYFQSGELYQYRSPVCFSSHSYYIISVVFSYFQLNFQFKKFTTVSRYPCNSHSKPFANHKLQCSFSYSFILSASIYSLLFSVFSFLDHFVNLFILLLSLSSLFHICFSVLSQTCCNSLIADFLKVAFLVSVRFYLLVWNVSPLVIFRWSLLTLLSGPYYFPLLLLSVVLWILIKNTHLFLLPAVQFSCWMGKTSLLCLYMLLCPLSPTVLCCVAWTQFK